MNDNKKVLVTGGAGYIGSHTCKALASKGYSPLVVDNLSHGHIEAVKWGGIRQGDICDKKFMKEVLRQYKPVAVIHFAAYSSVGESVSNPRKYYANNVIGALSLLDSCIEEGITKMVFSSTCATYGLPDVIPITEKEAQTPVNPYGSSKLMVEKILKDYSEAYGMRSVSLRYFNAAGADIDAEIGESHEPEGHLIPLILEVAAGKKPHISIYGNDYPTNDGSCIRDYIHVSDLAEAHINALEYLIGGGATIQINIGTGNGYSVKEVIRIAEEVTRKKIKTIVEGRRAGDAPELVADASLAKEKLAWQPKIGNLKEIIETAWNWSQHKLF